MIDERKPGDGMASNSFATLALLKGERIKGVLKKSATHNEQAGFHIIFESGNALTVNNNGTYYITVKKEMDKIIERMTVELRARYQAIVDALELAGETPK